MKNFSGQLNEENDFLEIISRYQQVFNFIKESLNSLSLTEKDQKTFNQVNEKIKYFSDPKLKIKSKKRIINVCQEQLNVLMHLIARQIDPNDKNLTFPDCFYADSSIFNNSLTSYKKTVQEKINGIKQKPLNETEDSLEIVARYRQVSDYILEKLNLLFLDEKGREAQNAVKSKMQDFLTDTNDTFMAKGQIPVWKNQLNILVNLLVNFINKDDKQLKFPDFIYVNIMSFDQSFNFYKKTVDEVIDKFRKPKLEKNKTPFENLVFWVRANIDFLQEVYEAELQEDLRSVYNEIEQLKFKFYGDKNQDEKTYDSFCERYNAFCSAFENNAVDLIMENAFTQTYGEELASLEKSCENIIQQIVAKNQILTKGLKEILEKYKNLAVNENPQSYRISLEKNFISQMKEKFKVELNFKFKEEKRRSAINLSTIKARFSFGSEDELKKLTKTQENSYQNDLSKKEEPQRKRSSVSFSRNKAAAWSTQVTTDRAATFRIGDTKNKKTLETVVAEIEVPQNKNLDMTSP